MIQRPRVLVVDDDPAFILLVRRLLNANCLVSEAENGEEALNSALTHKPDLFLVDLMMPQIDGAELVSNIKHDRRLNHIPVIVLSADATKESVISLIRLGVDDYILKQNINREYLLNKISAVLKRQDFQPEMV